MSEPIYFGETFCQCNGDACHRKAYYQIRGGKVACGQHSRGIKRTTLPKNPNAAAIREQTITRWKERCHDMALLREKGAVTCYKMKMMQNPPLVDGVVNIFPNFKHASRKDGMGMASLSPKSMGPIRHGQRGVLPEEAANLENLHQFNKVFPFMQDEKGDPLPQFFNMQRAAYASRIPYRHQHEFLQKFPMEGITVPRKRVNAPAYSLWVDKEGKQHRLSYVESRQIYCLFYEEKARELPEFKKLYDMVHKHHFHVCLCGYDAFQPDKSIDAHYLDPSRPFGHEMVLYTMLTVTDPNQYPWRIHATL